METHDMTMGRPPKFRTPTLIRLDQGVVERIDRVIQGHEKRADFFRRAIDRELVRREKLKRSASASAYSASTPNLSS